MTCIAAKVVLPSLIFLLAIVTPAQTDTKANAILKEQLQRQYMVQISKDIGVTCNHCHDLSNFKSNKRPTHKIASDHMRITKLLNEQGFRNKPKVSCYVCHQGHTKVPPENKE